MMHPPKPNSRRHPHQTTKPPQQNLPSGAAAPPTTIAYMMWVDTANTVLKMRDSANAVLKIRDSANAAWLAQGLNSKMDDTGRRLMTYEEYLRWLIKQGYEAEMADHGDQELDPHPNFLGAILFSLLAWAVVVGAVWGVWAAAKWVMG